MTARRFLFAIVDGGGNVPAELGVARRLIAAGHDVTVVGDDAIAPEIAATGAHTRRWVRAPNRPDRRPQNDPVRDWECRFPWQVAARLVDRVLVGPAGDYADDVAEAIAATRPDRVVCSMQCLGAMIAAEAAGLPFDVLFPNVYPLPAPGMPPFGLGLAPARGRVGRLRDRALHELGARLWDRGLARLNSTRRRYGLRPLDHVTDQLHHARRHLVLTSASFDFPAAVPAHVRYVGPILDDPAWVDAQPWTPPAGDAPLVLVAMSTTFQDQRACLQRVMDALATMPVRVVVTTGPALDPAELRARANTRVVASAPHREVLRHAAAVVTHGGHGTAIKALVAGVPLVVLPHGRDQADTAARVTERHAGIRLPRTAPGPSIAAAVDAVLHDPRFRAGARRLGDAIHRDVDDDGLLRALD